MKIWIDRKGQKWEVGSKDLEKKIRHRRVGEGDDKWKDGPSPG